MMMGGYQTYRASHFLRFVAILADGIIQQCLEDMSTSPTRRTPGPLPTLTPVTCLIPLYVLHSRFLPFVLSISAVLTRGLQDMAPQVWMFKKLREIARRMPSYRGEFAAIHPKYAANSPARCQEWEASTEEIVDLVYSAEDTAVRLTFRLAM